MRSRSRHPTMRAIRLSAIYSPGVAKGNGISKAGKADRKETEGR